MAGTEVVEHGVTVREAPNTSSLQRSILDLPRLVESELDPFQRKVFYQIFELDYDEAPVDYITEEARQKVKEQFGEEITLRKVLDVRNIILGEQTLTNPLRAKRPLDNPDSTKQINTYQQENRNLPQNCYFCNPDTSTPQDPFGVVRFGRARTVANAAAYTAWNSLAITDVHNPLELDAEAFSDMIHAGNEWYKEVMKYNPRYRFPHAGYNGLFRGGGSIFHPHLGLMMTTKPFEATENLRRNTRNYQNGHSYPYFDELAYCLEPLGLVHDIGSAHVIFNPVPKKEKEVFVYSNHGDGLPNGDLSKAAFQIIHWWREKLGVTSFDIVLYMPPLGINIKEEGDWQNFFPVMRLVDRGPEGQRVSDIGNMELYAASVVQSDSFKASDSFREYIREKQAA